jgi:hypothetical protein
MTPENRIKRDICDFLKASGALIFTHDSVGIFDPIRRVYRANRDPYRRKGVSDLLGIWKARFIAIEVKVPKQYPSKEQKQFLKDVADAGGIAVLARSVEDVRKALEI